MAVTLRSQRKILKGYPLSKFNFLLTKVARNLKGDASYTVDKSISMRMLLEFAFSRLLMLVRGYLFQITSFKFRAKMLFKSRNSHINYRSQFSYGRALTLGTGVNIDCLGKKGVVVGDCVSFGNYAQVRCTGIVTDLGEGIVIGDNVGVGAFNILNGQGGIFIGNDVIMGPNVSIMSENHNFQDITKPIRLQGVARAPVIIEKNVWIGANVTILAGVTVGSGSVIGAGSVVTKSIPDNSIAFGIPCKVVKTRKV